MATLIEQMLARMEARLDAYLEHLHHTTDNREQGQS